MKVKIDVTVVDVLETQFIERLQRFLCDLLEAEIDFEATIQGVEFGVNCKDDDD